MDFIFISVFFGSYLIILYAISKKWIIPIIAMISTPLFHHFISFSDVSMLLHWFC
ncbi:hypothetical protein LEP1GSC088_3550 [Leptospira interrogans str. L1207]|nr:hypothetical protein LEP1GSC088_3550 [Leptospira interrogans str. L1207]